MKHIVLIIYLVQHLNLVKISISYPLQSASDQVIGQWLIHLKPMRVTTLSTNKKGNERSKIIKRNEDVASNDDDDTSTTIKSYFSNFLNILFPKQKIKENDRDNKSVNTHESSDDAIDILSIDVHYSSPDRTSIQSL